MRFPFLVLVTLMGTFACGTADEVESEETDEGALLGGGGLALKGKVRFVKRTSQCAPNGGICSVVREEPMPVDPSSRMTVEVLRSVNCTSVERALSDGCSSADKGDRPKFDGIKPNADGTFDLDIDVPAGRRGLRTLHVNKVLFKLNGKCEPKERDGRYKNDGWFGDDADVEAFANKREHIVECDSEFVESSDAR